MEKDNIIAEKYETDLRLNVIYEILDKFYTPFQDVYPKDVSGKISELMDTIGKYIYPCKKGYDIVGEKHYSVLSYRKC